MLAHLYSAIRGNRLATDDRGVVMVYVALSLVVIMGFVAVVLDFGSLALNYRTSQNAVDTAAFAAAEAARTDTTGTITAAAIAAKVDPIIARYGYAAGELTLTYLDSSNAAVAPSAAIKVRAQIDHAVATSLAHSLIAGASAQSLETTRSAAMIGSGPANAFFLLGTTGTKQLFVNGTNTSLTVNNGGMYLGLANSVSTAAIQALSSTIQVTGAGDTISQYSTDGTTSSCSGCLPNPPGVVPTSVQMADPFANIATPAAGVWKGAFSWSSGTTTIDPGDYDSITVKGGTVTMNSGIYRFGMNGFTINGGTVTGNGVMLYFTCGAAPGPLAACLNTGQAGGVLSLNSGTYLLSAPTSGQYQGLLVFYDRHNSGTMNLTTNSTSNLIGSMYSIFPHAGSNNNDYSLTLAGQSSATLGNCAFVISNIKLTGGVSITDNYGDGSQYRKGGESVGTAW